MGFVVLQKLKEHDAKIAEHDSTLMLLKTMSGSGNGEGGQAMLDALEILVENLRKECYSKFADRDDFNQSQVQMKDLLKRMEQLERRTDTNEENIQDAK